MAVARWVRTTGKLAVSLLLAVPIVALPLAVLFDRGPSADTRLSPHLFALVVWLYDDFAWTCVRHSAGFALVLSLLSFVLGGFLGRSIALSNRWGRAIPRGLLVFSASSSPAIVALGIAGLFGPPDAWLWPSTDRSAGSAGASLESWRGVPLWLAWIWSSLPWGVSAVALATAAAMERVDRTWEDAARMTGVAALRAWRRLIWPLVRPSAARAAAVVFAVALVEPGAPLMLGLRRTLAFQIVEISRRPDPFPTLAAWAIVSGIVALAGRLSWRWAGGRQILAPGQDHRARPEFRPRIHRFSAAGLVGLTIATTGWFVFIALPCLGLIRAVNGLRRAGAGVEMNGLSELGQYAAPLVDPSVIDLLTNSILMGLGVMLAMLVLRWLDDNAAAPTGGVGGLRHAHRVGFAICSAPRSRGGPSRDPVDCGVGRSSLSELSTLESPGSTLLRGERCARAGPDTMDTVAVCRCAFAGAAAVADLGERSGTVCQP